MKINIIMLIVIFAVFALYFNEPEAMEPLRLKQNLTSFYDDTFKITNEQIPYTNLYQKNITTKNVVYNIMHPIIYTIMTEINTIIPVGLHMFQNGISPQIKGILICAGIFWIITTIPQIIKTIITLYFFIKEKKKTKTKIYE